MDRMEELAYRGSGQFNATETKSIFDIYKVGRGHDTYDR